MPTLLEEEEEREGGEKRSKDAACGERVKEEVGNEVEIGEVGLDGEGEREGGEEKGRGENEAEKKEEEEEIAEERGGESEEEEEQKVHERESDTQYPISSTPASKTPESPLVKTDSFSEYLRATGESDCCSVSSLVSLPEGLFEGSVRHKDGSSIAVVFQVCTYIHMSKSEYLPL